jgi:hypothetical protein
MRKVGQIRLPKSANTASVCKGKGGISFGLAKTMHFLLTGRQDEIGFKRFELSALVPIHADVVNPKSRFAQGFRVSS